MKKVLVSAVLLWQAVCAQEGGTISGKVILEATGDPLHHVKVVVGRLGRTVETNNSGQFVLENVPPGKYELVAHLHALSDARQTVELAAGSKVEVEFRLAVAAVREEVTVTASGKEETTLESMQSATSLDTTDLAAQTATSLGDVLENQAGMAKRSSGPGTSRPVIRGFDGDRVLIMQDGVRTGTLSSQSGDHGEPVNPNSIERVEIVRGPGTLLYEGNAIGGVVNVITGHHQIHREPHDGLRGYFTGLGGTNNNRRGGSGGFEYGIGKWMLTGSAGTVYASDYKTPLGRVENSANDIKDGSLGVGHYGEKTFFDFSYMQQRGQYGIPLNPEDPEEVVTLPFRRHNVRFSGGLKDLGPVAELFQLSLNYSDWQHKEFDRGTVANQFSNKQFVYRGVFDQKVKGRLTGSFGFWGMTRDYKAQGEEALTPPVQQAAFALYGVEGLNLKRMRVQFGARVEHNSYDPVGLEKRSFTGVAASVGTNLPLWKGGALVASYSSSFRSPALEELYNNGPHAGNLTFEIGDNGLKRERGNGMDLSFRHQNGRVRAEANYFYYRLSDYVFLAPTGEIRDALAVALYRQGTSRYRGVEGRLSTSVGKDVWVHVGLDAVNAELIGPVQPLPRIPPLRGRIGADFRFGALSIMPELVTVNRQDRVYGVEEPTAGYAAMNVKGLYSITSKHLLHLFGVQVSNAGDRLYRNHLSFLKAFAPEMGRGVLFTYTVRVL